MVSHRRVLALIVVLLIVILIALPVFPATLAQDNTPILTFEPSPTFHFVTDTPAPPTETSTPEMTLTPSATYTASPTATPDFANLPFSDTFDSEQGWLPQGAWLFDLATSYASGGWHVDGTQRGTVSTLTYYTMIDMSGTLTAQLVYRQMGHLPQTDLVSAEISLDNGQNWLVIDQQIGIDSDWDLHIVDLTDYRGQLIRLRFRVDTGMPITDSTIPIDGYWIDNLTIQYVMMSPEVAALLPPAIGPRTLMGLHLIVGARKDPIVELARRLQEAGRPLGSLKGTSGTEDILNAVAQVSPDTVIIYRSLTTPWGMVDCPNTGNDPTLEAQQWITGVSQSWYGVNADYYEIMNECSPPVEWMVAFTIEAMRIATQQGRCLLVFSFSTGQPEPGYFAQLRPVFEYALQNPCVPGRYHGIALHEYGYQRNTLVSESGITLGFRHRMLYAALLNDIPKAIELPVYLTEAGPGDGGPHFSCETVVRDVLQYTNQLEYDPYVRGFDLWTAGPPSGQWIDVTSCLPALGDALINYYNWRSQQ